MKKYVVLTLSVIGLIAGLYAQKVIYQTDWHEGPGQAGPIDGIPTGRDGEYDFGLKFDNSTNINYLYEWGRISLSVEMNTSPTLHNIAPPPTNRSTEVMTGDMDSDGDMDVIALVEEGTSNGHISWFENDGTGGGWIEHLVNIDAWGHFDIKDMDEDGDADIILADNPTYVYWLENNGDGTSFTSHLVGTRASGNIASVGSGDFDNDGDIDILGSTNHNTDNNAVLHWFKNSGDNINFTRVVLTTPPYGGGLEPGPIKTGDINGDGYPDFAMNGGTSANPDSLLWWEYIPSSDTFVNHRIYTTQPYNNGGRTYDWLCDMDHDEDLDFLTLGVPTTGGNSYVDWWVNDGSGNFTRNTISSNYASYVGGIVGIDMDYDGDVDIMTGNWNGGAIDWWVREGNSFTRQSFGSGYHCYSMWVADISGNGFFDLITTTWYNREGSVDWWDLFDHFNNPGDLYSSIFDSKIPYAVWRDVDMDADIKPNTNVEVYVRASDDPSDLGDWIKADPNGYISGAYGRYMQYWVHLTTEDGDYSPLVYELRFTYFGGDIGIDSIIWPGDTTYRGQEINPRIKVVNPLPVMNDECEVVFEIREVDGGEPVYADTEYVPQITGGEYEYITFDKKWTPGDEGTFYYMRAYVVYEYERADSNNELKDTTYVPSGIEVDERGDIRIVQLNRRIEIEGVSGEVRVIDSAGRVVVRGEIRDGRYVWDYGNSASGIYYVIVDTHGRRITEKVVVTR